MAPVQYQRQSLYSLTSLQLGDMQSYVSKLYLHVEKRKLVFFVDNGPWTAKRGQRSMPVELWQLMVTQSRISPFANRSLRGGLVERIQKENAEELDTKTADVPTMNKGRRLFDKDQSRLVELFRNLFQTRLRSVVSMQELSHLLHGCVTFELEWKNIRGINYVNELQTDTCVALELKFLVKRDFCDIKEAKCFYGIEHPEAFSTSLDVTPSPRHSSQTECLRSSNSGAHADSSSGNLSSDEFFSDYSYPKEDQYQRDDQIFFYDRSDSDSELFDAVSHLDRAPIFEIDSCTRDVVTRTGEFVEGRLDVNCTDHFFDAIQDSCKFGEQSVKEITVNSHDNFTYPHMPVEEGGHLGDFGSATPDSPHSSHSSDDISSSWSLEDENEEEAVYIDTLLIFRFCDPILPLELKQIITADQRLLKMLESGLPSWVIFLQSYPVVRKLYRPWMRPLAKTMYILVSIITVIIGFYDLYKNVPVLKATAARICGPFFEWIEAWEMVSRVKYLGTVLFLQNWEKAFRWLLLAFGTMKKLSNLILQPMIEPLEELVDLVWPVWNLIIDSVWGLTSLLWMMCSSVFEYTNLILQLLVLPFIWSLTALWTLGTWILYPVIYAVWGFIIFPIRSIMMLGDFIVALMCNLYKAIQSCWLLINSSFQILSVAGPQAGKTANSSASTLRLLWNDIFSQVFRAVRSIVNVFVAFFTTCNRHRLSIYNHTEAFISQLRGLVKFAPWKVSNSCHQALDTSPLNQDGFEDEGHRRSSRGSAMGLTPRQKSRRKASLADK
eukprot:c21247_g1_i1 orf=661-2994(+)